MIKGYVIKRSDTDYVVNCNEKGNGGYNVVSKTFDPSNAYTIKEVESYLAEHPDMLLDASALDAEDSRSSEISSLKAYLASTDYIYPKCIELELNTIEEYPEIVAQRIVTRKRIRELEEVDE